MLLSSGKIPNSSVQFIKNRLDFLSGVPDSSFFSVACCHMKIILEKFIDKILQKLGPLSPGILLWLSFPFQFGAEWVHEPFFLLLVFPFF